MKGTNDYEVVIGIDFGSSGSGYAYSYFDKSSIIYGQIQGASVYHKVPTEIILDDNNFVTQFGAGCVGFLKEKGLKAGHYFKGIKMHLYENSRTIVAHNSGKKLPLKLVIQKVLESIKELAIKEIAKNRPYLSKETDKIKWIVTVPAIWNEHQKSIMMDSCIEAGLINKNTDRSLFFALEPEAASLYCSINKEIDRKFFEMGEYYIVCDLGGGTGDIVAHLVGTNNYLNEIFPSCGGNFGSNEIDKLIFKDIIFKLFRCQDFNNFYLKYKKLNINNNDVDEDVEKGELFNDWCEFEREIKNFKEGATNLKIEKNERKPINCSIFQDIFEDSDIEDLVDEYNGNIYNFSRQLTVKKVKKKWIVEFPYIIIYDYMEKQAKSICKIINDINTKEEIKTIIFVGGYCENELILKLIKKGLNKIETYLQPSNPSLAIMEGAVLFGIEPSTINVRKAKYTIGKKIESEWNENIHSGKGKKYFNEDDETWYCSDCFDKYIEINQSLKYEEEVSRISYMMYKNQKSCLFKFYKTKSKNPTFIFEEGMEKIGECTLDVGQAYEKYEDRKIKTIMKFGGTFIDVTGIHLKSGKTIKTTLTFD